MTTVNGSESAPSDLAGDMCNGVEEIAEYTDDTIRATYHKCSKRQIPAFKLGGQWRMRKSAYRELVELLEREALDKALASAREGR